MNDNINLQHQRLIKVEQLVAKTAASIQDLNLRMDILDEHVEGLAHAHDATLAAVNYSSKSAEALDTTLQKLDGRVQDFTDAFSGHLITEERDRRTLPYAALAIWLSSLALLVWVGSIYLPGIKELLRRIFHIIFSSP